MTHINLHTGVPDTREYLTDRPKFTWHTAEEVAAYRSMWAGWSLTRKFNNATPRWSHPIFPRINLKFEDLKNGT